MNPPGPRPSRAALPTPRVRRLGLVPYEPTWRRMQAFTDTRTPATPDELWALSHPPVFTLGQQGRREHLLAPGTIPVVQIDRGGHVTYHGPGQLVIYPLLDLRRLRLGVRELVSALEQAVIDILDGYGVVVGVVTGQRDGTVGSGPVPRCHIDSPAGRDQRGRHATSHTAAAAGDQCGRTHRFSPAAPPVVCAGV